MADFRSILEKKIDDAYVSKRNALEDNIMAEVDYRQSFGYLRALRDVIEMIKESARSINNG